ncbi:MAG: hypothetical protein V3U76_16895 [Granulosicoccus sp.]
MPGSLKRFQVVLTMLLFAGSALFAFTVASLQQVDGQGVWDTSEEVTIEGFLTVDPYPVLHRSAEAENGQAQSVLMVMVGKHSADVVAEKHANTMVSVRGFSVSRGGWLMLELADETAVTPLDTAADVADPAMPGNAESLGTVTLVGEVVGSKCFLGVMNPGGGPVHRACAEVCLLGGVPPMLVVKDRQQRKFGYMLTSSDGSSAAEQLTNIAAESVQVTGELTRNGDLLYLAIGKLDNVNQAVASVARTPPTLFASQGVEPWSDEICTVVR